ncbi:LpqB family beta-propeller domain-containing protein [Actinokineospora sp. NBRC 105648]|uniref:LpqB family beta-propeller domain-containing protein n=1 Tax=Actinokineospora sp. NBRC 105648 TaxID=3032206 RepID=UPI0024A318F8|nr:LpqB family beta-propeller domain-containing protein [Actinokineospora sp. NBRC 105648]GLZ38473.1 lipoprotein [Actinokineospora sp. NBRC 105648]
MKRLLIALFCAFLAAGCANIPDRTLPKIVVEATEQPQRQIGKPAPGLDPFSLVQGFVNNAGTPDIARTYLTEDIKPNWKGSAEPPTIIKNESVRTVPQSVQEGRDNANEQVVVLTATALGRLVGDRSFVPGVQSVTYRVILRREDGQWRIAEPPNTMLINQSDFEASYRRVNLEFFDLDQRVLVPDLRYVETEPRQGLSGRVLDLLLAGPSEPLRGAVRSPLDGVTLSTNVVEEAGGAILINLSRLDKPIEDRQRIAAQLVYSLRDVTSSPLRLRVEGADLVPDHQDWTVGDVGSYDALTTLKPDLFGLAVVDGRLRSLRDGKPVEGPTGAGAYDIVSAAQSLDGTQLAVVQRTPVGMRLRVGRTNAELPEVSLSPTATLTRPTWLVGGASENGPSEVWTVQDGTLVVRVVRTADGKWDDFPVDASEFTQNGGTITQLRLSRDGARVAAVVNGEVKVASVVRTNDAVTISAVRTLQGGVVKDVIGLDWLDRLTLIVATEQTTLPVASMPIDGLTYTRYNTTNLTLPVRAITAAPSRSAIVTDGSGVWFTQEAGKVWQLHQYVQAAGALPFYPG